MPCVPIHGGVLCVPHGPYRIRYTSGGGRERTLEFDWHSYHGPTFYRRNGDAFVPGERHPVWAALGRWDSRGKPVASDGFVVLTAPARRVNLPGGGAARPRPTPSDHALGSRS